MADTLAPAPQVQTPLPELLRRPEVVRSLKDAFGDAPYCARCLGRPLAKAARGTPNADTGAKVAAVTGIRPVAPMECSWCEGLFEDLDTYTDLIVSALSAREYGSFLVGTRLHPDLVHKETGLQTVLADLGDHFEPLRNEMNREVGTRVVERTQKEVDFEHPDVSVLLDPHFDLVELTIRSIYLHGRYRKFDRTIPQTKWPCRDCRGHGCKRCGGTGKMYATSVEEEVSAVALQAFGSPDGAFHGAGREDIDALMLGTGRPFVVELRDPLYREPRDPDDGSRRITLQDLEARIIAHARPRVEIEGLRPSDKDEVVAIKEATHDKAYRAHVVAESPIGRAALDEAVRAITGTTIEQRTPERVSHRRADLVRKRTVHEVRIASFGHHVRATLEASDADAAAANTEVDPATAFTLDILAASGTYIKELVHGDEGRTQPSFAGLLGVSMRVAFLDVLGVHDGPEPDDGR